MSFSSNRSKSNPNSLAIQCDRPQSLSDRRQRLRQEYQHCRTATLSLVETLEPDLFYHQSHPEFSPVGWHFGHIGYTESLWILQHCAKRSPQFPQYHRLFASDGLPKAERQNLPDFATLLDYLNTIRSHVFEYLDIAPLDEQDRLWWWLLQHESQHNEVMTLVLQLHDLNRRVSDGFRPTTMQFQSSNSRDVGELAHAPMQLIPAGEVVLGNEGLDGLDNEKPCYRVHLNDYAIDRYPVTCADYRRFMDAGGYNTEQYWSTEGWHWLQQYPVSRPLYWSNAPDWDDHPVCGVSWYEAEAYATFVGKRLPTEAEWEKAAKAQKDPLQVSLYPWGNDDPTATTCNHHHHVGHTTPVHAYPKQRSAYGCEDMLGNVWEWTADWFMPYPNFQWFPYPGYSQTYFDQAHKVLRGGSWATRPWALRSTFRNWYYPGMRQMIAGFRCAQSLPPR